jgi:hypothetical protein
MSVTTEEAEAFFAGRDFCIAPFDSHTIGITPEAVIISAPEGANYTYRVYDYNADDYLKVLRMAKAIERKRKH